MQFDEHIHATARINPFDLNDSVVFSLSSPPGQNIHLNSYHLYGSKYTAQYVAHSIQHYGAVGCNGHFSL